MLFLLSHGIDIRKRLFKYTEEIFGGCLKYIICIGKNIDEDYVNFFRTFGIEVLNGYGVPETSSVISINRNGFNKPGSVGQVVPGCDFTISEDGEILIKGPMVMKGYYKDFELTKYLFKKGWLRTGDIGYMDSDGFLYIVGRKKNVITLSNGEMISPNNIEEQVLNITAIKEVAVYNKNDKIVAEIFPDYKFLKDNNVLEIGNYIRSEIKSLNRNLAKSKKIDRVIIRKSSFPEPLYSSINKYKVLTMS